MLLFDGNFVLEVEDALDDGKSVEVGENGVFVGDIFGSDGKHLGGHEVHFEEIALCVDLKVRIYFYD